MINSGEFLVELSLDIVVSDDELLGQIATAQGTIQRLVGLRADFTERGHQHVYNQECKACEDANNSYQLGVHCRSVTSSVS